MKRTFKVTIYEIIEEEVDEVKYTNIDLEDESNKTKYAYMPTGRKETKKTSTEIYNQTVNELHIPKLVTVVNEYGV